jgi:hypothetical protein
MADDGRIDNGRINGVEVNHNMFARSGRGFARPGTFWRRPRRGTKTGVRAGARLARACATLVTLVLLAACGVNDATFRYRLAVSVSINGAALRQTGSSGWEIGVHDNYL